MNADQEIAKSKLPERGNCDTGEETNFGNDLEYLKFPRSFSAVPLKRDSIITAISRHLPSLSAARIASGRAGLLSFAPAGLCDLTEHRLEPGQLDRKHSSHVRV